MKTRDEMIDVLIGLVLTGLELGAMDIEVAGAIAKATEEIITLTPEPFTLKQYKDIAFEHMANDILADSSTPEEVKTAIQQIIKLRRTVEEIMNTLTNAVDKNIWDDALDEIEDNGLDH